MIYDEGLFSDEEPSSSKSSHSNHEAPGNKENPIQHLKLEDITSLDVAIKTFNETTKKIKSRSALSPKDMAEIHVITYSLEKAVAYFVKNLEGEGKKVAKKIAIVVEEIHLASENNKKEKCQKSLSQYNKLVNSFTQYTK